MSSYKQKRINWIVETYNDRINRAIELVDKIVEKYGTTEEQIKPLPNEPLTLEYWDLVAKILDEIRDKFFCTQRIAENLFFMTIRLRRRGKI